MNANELADDVDDVLDVLVANRILNPSIEKEVLRQAVTMLRQFGLSESIIKQQQLEIEALKKENADMNRRLLGCDIYEQ